MDRGRTSSSGACSVPRTRGSVHGRARLGRWWALPLAAVVAAVLAPLAGASADGGKAPLSPLARVSVVGSGPLAWGKVAVRNAPSRDAGVVATLDQFRPDFHPRTVLALDARVGRTGEPTWYRISVPGRPTVGRAGSRPRRPT